MKKSILDRFSLPCGFESWERTTHHQPTNQRPTLTFSLANVSSHIAWDWPLTNGDVQTKKLAMFIRIVKKQHLWNKTTTCFSPPVRWRLLDFMSVSSPSASSSRFLLLPPPPVAILWVQCGVLDPNRDPASSVWRAGPQPRSCEFSVACRTPTVISWVQCCVPDLNCDPASSVWRAGPQLRSCEFSVACRTSTVMERIGSSCRKSVSKK